jgi:cobalt-zinc-cadmium efflux system outer membrane protein
MIHPLTGRRLLGLAILLVAGMGAEPVAPPPPAPAALPPAAVHLEEAVQMALHDNPEIAAYRQLHGIAAAAVVIARTYPFNPVWTNKVFADNGPESAGITNRLALEERVSIDLEVRHQGKYRREAACNALSKADWDIANQELVLTLRVIRAFKGVLYYEAKLGLGEETIRLNQHTVDQVSQLVEKGVLKVPDLILAKSEVYNTRGVLEAARAARLKAWQDLRRALGMTEGAFTVEGKLDTPSSILQAEALVQTALERRPDLRARQAALSEAEARLKLAVADRFGNPNLGPDYEYNETRVNFIGAQMTVPLPIFNTRRGEICQRQAERSRAILDLRNTETVIRQDVTAALERLQNARAWADTYRSHALPELESSLKDMESLFDQGGVPVLSVIDIRRKLLRARDSYLDVLFELAQAQADLAAAVADPGLVILPCAESH